MGSRCWLPPSLRACFLAGPGTKTTWNLILRPLPWSHSPSLGRRWSVVGGACARALHREEGFIIGLLNTQQLGIVGEESCRAVKGGMAPRVSVWSVVFPTSTQRRLGRLKSAGVLDPRASSRSQRGQPERRGLRGKRIVSWGWGVLQGGSNLCDLMEPVNYRRESLSLYTRSESSFGRAQTQIPTVQG